MKVLKENANAIILCVVEIVVGVLLLVNPVGFTLGIIIAAGIALMFSGLLNVIRYFRSSPQEAAVGQLLMQGLVALLAGAFCAFNPQWFTLTFPMIAVLYGIAVLVGGLSKVQTAVDMLRAKNSKWWWGAIGAALSIICALVIIKNPFSTTVALWWFTGISLIVEAVFDMVTLIMGRRKGGSAEV